MSPSPPVVVEEDKEEKTIWTELEKEGRLSSFRTSGDGGMDGRRDACVLSQTLPVTCLTVLEEHFVMGAEGSSILLFFTQGYRRRSGKERRVERFQVFPNHRHITGIAVVKEGRVDNSVVEEPCHKVLVWGGNLAAWVTIPFSVRQSSCVLSPPRVRFLTSLDYIPIAAKCFSLKKTVVILSVYNRLVLYNYNNGVNSDPTSLGLQEVERWESYPENLYSGDIYGSIDLNHLIVFAGTTLNGIIVWKVDEMKKVTVTHQMDGHDGIPFSLEFDPRTLRLLSCSDDRKVIVWQFKKKTVSCYGMRDIETDEDESDRTNHALKLGPDSSKLLEIEKHDSRIWQAMFADIEGLPQQIVSVGEDSSVHVEFLDQTFSKTWNAHRGAPIYSAVYNSMEEILYTAAKDGGVHRWSQIASSHDPILVKYDHVKQNTPFEPPYLKLGDNGRSEANSDYPRNICLWSRFQIIASMDSGRLILLNGPFFGSPDLQSDFFWSKELMRYAVLRVSRVDKVKVLCVGGKDGDLFLFSDKPDESVIRSPTTLPKKVWYKKFPSKIINIHWLNEKELLCLIVTLDDAHVYKFHCKEESGEVKWVALDCGTLELSIEKPGLPAALLTNNNASLIVGDECGSISLYNSGHLKLILRDEDGLTSAETIEDNNSHLQDEFTRLKRENRDHVFVLTGVHREGVTCLLEYKSLILSAGRYGGVKTLGIDTSLGIMYLLHQVSPPFDWVAGMIPIFDQKELLVSGFLKGDFVVFSWEQQRVVTEIPNLGGGHRRWNWICDEDGPSSLAYLRDKEIYFSFVDLKEYVDSVVLKPGFHSRTINTGVILYENAGRNSVYLATGSEDGSIRVTKCEFGLQMQGQQFQTVHRMTDHSSGVRALIFLKEDEDHILLFSGGSRSEIFATRFGLGNHATDFHVMQKVDVIKGRGNEDKETDIDIRIMDLAFLNVNHELDGLPKEKNNACYTIAAACSDGNVRLVLFSTFSRSFKVKGKLLGNHHAIMKLRVHRFHNQDHTIVAVTSNGCMLMWTVSPRNLMELVTKSVDHGPFYYKRILSCPIMSIDLLSKAEGFYLALGGDDCSVSLWKVIFDDSTFREIKRAWRYDQEQRGAVTGICFGANKLIYTLSNDQVVSEWTMDGYLRRSYFAGVTDCQGFALAKDTGVLICYGDGVTCVAPPGLIRMTQVQRN